MLPLCDTMTDREALRFAITLGKPKRDEPCNGCGYCCMMVQCKISIAAFGEHKTCPALEFKDGKYRCGLMCNLGEYAGKGKMPGLPAEDIEDGQRLLREIIGAGKGCDAYDPRDPGFIRRDATC